MDTVFGLSPSNSAATADGPPRRPITSRDLHIGKLDITFCKVLQEAKRDVAALSPYSHNVSMARKPDDYDETAAQMKANILWLEKRSGLERTEFANRMGLSYGAYKNALDRPGFRTKYLVKLAKSLDVSMDFVCGLTTELRPLSPQTIREATFWELTQAAPGKIEPEREIRKRKSTN